MRVSGLLVPVADRKAWHGHSLRRAIQTDDRTDENLLEDATAAGSAFDTVFFAFTAHEIQPREARVRALASAGQLLTDGGHLTVIEHLCDLRNALVYGPGWHFLPRRMWLADFADAGLVLVSERRIEGLVAEFTLASNGERD